MSDVRPEPETYVSDTSPPEPEKYAWVRELLEELQLQLGDQPEHRRWENVTPRAEYL